MLARYTLEPMQRLWGDPQTKFQFWLKVELAMLKARQLSGQITEDAYNAIAANAKIDVDRIDQLEVEYRHDMIAFVVAVQESLTAAGVGQYKEELHKLLTSYDTEDPAMILMLRRAVELVLTELELLSDALCVKAYEHRETLMIARTHGQFAEPTTFGQVLLVHYYEIDRSLGRLRHLLETELAEGKMSGAVGSYAGLDPKLEAAALKELGLKPAKAETQILQRDRHATVLNTLAVAAGSIERLARTFWEMMRSDTQELQEPRGAKQRGSSAMAHKRNPILTEQLMGLPRLLRGHAHAAMENIATPEGRDISQSSVERHIFPDATSLLHYMAARATALVARLVVFPERMAYNLNTASRGVWASQLVRTALMEAGVDYNAAYDYLQQASFRTDLALKQAVSELPLSGADPRTALLVLGQERLDQCFDAWAYVQPGIKHLFSDWLKPEAA